MLAPYLPFLAISPARISDGKADGIRVRYLSSISFDCRADHAKLPWRASKSLSLFSLVDPEKS
jgi:hypothetical protein